MNAFVTPEWESNPIADKTCDQLFKGSKSPTNSKKKNKKAEKKEFQLKSGHIEKTKSKRTLQKFKNTLKKSKTILNNEKSIMKSDFSQTSKTKKGKKKKEIPSVSSTPTENKTKIQEDEARSYNIKKNKPKVTHQTLFCQTLRKNRNKSMDEKSKSLEYKKKSKNSKLTGTKINNKNYEDKSQLQDQFSPKTAKKLKLLPLRERMLEKLKAARFRYLNEQMYTTSGGDAKQYFENDPDAYEAYHDGYRQQVAQWPINPLDVVIEKIKKLPKTHIIADFGCGEAKLAKSVLQKVHSFDLVAVNSSVIPCDMTHVPLEDGSINVAVFCLSLMGTNLRDYLLEAYRVLKIGGLLKIAEVESRFSSIDEFIKSVEALGFAKVSKNLSYDLFCFLDFTKRETNGKAKKKLPNITLEPCLYKKR
ncbi:hypothetical protein ILUMI_00910 [Ignelater luminosus]|uniref:Ribosomal RNA-processing protein 8 n=1 Tax=Ignelater luminosus TaxID=2038154 RepID=A0A8K0DGA8_IGNLU|nr:hypothetical protein ILUMI_00910 [Ignelater luminosus]